MEKLVVCQVCGHIEFGEAPQNCPVCFAEKESFKEATDAIHPSEQEGKEKHMPVVAINKACGLIPDQCQDVHIKVGSIPHPMEAEHWIQWIDIYLNQKFLARYMMGAESLQAAVSIHMKADQKGTLAVIENCNKHGSWKAEIQI